MKTFLLFSVMSFLVLPSVTRAADADIVAKIKTTQPDVIVEEKDGRVVTLTLYRCGEAEAELIAQLDALTRLELNGSPFTPKSLRTISKLPNVKYLGLGNSQIKDEDLAALSNMNSLEEIDLRVTKITGEGLTALARLPRLRKFNLIANKLTIKGMEVLSTFTNATELRVSGIYDEPDLYTRKELAKVISSMPNLESLTVDRLDMVNDDLVPLLNALRRLKELDVSSTNMTVVGRRAVVKAHPGLKLRADRLETPENAMTFEALRAKYPKIQVGYNPEGKINYVSFEPLSLRRDFGGLDSVIIDTNPSYVNAPYDLADHEIEALLELPELSELNISYAKLNNAGFELILKIKTLRQLYLKGTNIEDSDIKRLAALPDLITLGLGDTGIGDAGFKDLTVLKNLQKLWVWGTRIRDYSTLRSFPELTLLWANSALNDEQLEHVAALSKLEILHFHKSTVTGAGLKKLSRLPIRVLDLEKLKVSAQDLQALDQFPKLETVSLPGQADDTTITALAAAKGLQRLEVAGSQVTGKTFTALADHPKLKYVELQYSKIDDEGLASISQVQALETLYAFRNYAITGDGLRHIAALSNLKMLSLFENNKITTLKNLRSNSVVSLDLQYVEATGEDFEGLADMKALTTINLMKSGFTDGAMKYFQPLANLKTVILSATKISDISALKGKTTLESLDLTETEVGDNSVETLLTLENLQTLQLSFSKITPDAAIKLSGLKKLRRLTLPESASQNEDFLKRFKEANPQVKLTLLLD